MPANTYDAIIVGSGITGGWAAKELTEKGLNVLILEAGRTIDPGTEGFEFVVGDRSGKRVLIIRDGQHEYTFTETA